MHRCSLKAPAQWSRAEPALDRGQELTRPRVPVPAVLSTQLQGGNRSDLGYTTHVDRGLSGVMNTANL